MFEKYKIIKKIRKVKEKPVNSAFLAYLQSELKKYMAANPVIKTEAKRHNISEGINLFNLFKIKYITALIIVLAAILIGGGFAYASQSSLPGETLYPVKIMSEEMRSALTLNPRAKAEYQTELARERVKEIKSILNQGGVEPKGLNVAITSLEKHMAAAAEIIDKEKSNNKDISELAKTINDDFSDNKEELRNIFQKSRKELKNKELKIIQEIDKTATEEAAKKELNDKLEKIKEEKERLNNKEDEIEEKVKDEEEKVEKHLESGRVREKNQGESERQREKKQVEEIKNKEEIDKDEK